MQRAYAYFAQSRDLYAAFQLLDYMREEEEMLEYIAFGGTGGSAGDGGRRLECTTS